MPKYNFGVAVAFGEQEAEGSYNDALDAITTSLSYAETPGADAMTAGLVLGDADAGVRQSGLTLTLGRKKKDSAFLGATFTRSISSFLAAEVPTFTFALPFVGNRATVSGAPADADAIPIAGLDALLQGAGLVGVAWASGVGHQYTFGSPFPISSLIYISGMRLELMDCRCQLSIEFPYGAIPILTATIEVGSIKDQSVAAIPTTLTFGEQSSVSAPTCKLMGNQWQDTRGFQTGTLTIAPEITEIGDVNAATGIVKEQTDREVTFEADLFSDDTVDEGYEYSQLIEATQGNLDPLSFLVGTAMADTFPAEAVGVVMDDPELIETSPIALGAKAAQQIKLVARGSSAGNNEIEINFQ
jgi:hypothetical protein